MFLANLDTARMLYDASFNKKASLTQGLRATAVRV